MEEERNGALWDGNEKSIFTRPHDRQCLLLGVSTSVTLDQIHILSFVADSATADLHIAAKPHGYTGRHCISEDKSGKSAASPQVFLGAHVCSCLSPPPPPPRSLTSLLPLLQRRPTVNRFSEMSLKV